jgi:hypothetical protein
VTDECRHAWGPINPSATSSTHCSYWYWTSPREAWAATSGLVVTIYWRYNILQMDVAYWFEP